MGSIGDAFPYSAPVLGSTNWANWILVTDELITRVSSPVPLSSLTAGTFDLDNSSIINVKDVQFIDNGVALPTTPGLMEFHNDEFWFITSAGAIQITQAGSLNTTINGGIGGDYGGANPASVRFIDASNRYDFYDDFGTLTWAYGRFRALDLANGATGLGRARLSFTGVASVDFELPATLPASDAALVQLDSSGAITFNDSGNPLTTDLVLGSGIKIQHDDRIINAVPVGLTSQGTFTTLVCGFQTATLNAGHAIIYLTPTDIQVGWRIKSVGIQCNKADGTFATTELFTTIAGSPTAVSLATGSSNGAGLTLITATLGSPYTVVTGFGITLVVNSAAVGDAFGNLTITYDQPA